MPNTPHIERHFTAGEIVRDIVIGMSDGLTVPFALAAGISGAVAANNLVITAGLAEIAAGSIAMGLGGYLAARSDAEHYQSEKRREFSEVEEMPRLETEEVREVFAAYGLTNEQIEPITEAFRQNPKHWVEFMMRHELGLEEPNPKRAVQSAITIAVSYIVGGMIPLAPYVFVAQTHEALRISIVVTIIALFVFGFVKAKFTGANSLKSAIQTALIGGIAAGVAFALAKLIG